MTQFVNAVNNFFVQEKGISIDTLDYKEMPNEREKYNLSKIIGNVNLVAKRFKTKSDANLIVEKFLSMPLP